MEVPIDVQMECLVVLSVAKIADRGWGNLVSEADWESRCGTFLEHFTPEQKSEAFARVVALCPKSVSKPNIVRRSSAV